MARRKKGRDVHGVVLLDKPAGISSNQALQKVRWLFQARKAGHTGTLDPFATGMLPICLGEASKTAGFMLESSKTYHATARLGQATETGDTEGEIVEESTVPELTDSEIDRAFDEFRGQIEQVPPMYSALKHQGRPLYQLAREGKTVERKPRSVFIHRLELVSWDSPELVFEVNCSKGTYVRTLAEDIARALGSCAHLIALRRLTVEPFDPQRMVTLEDLAQAAETGAQDGLLLPLDTGLSDWPIVELDGPAAERFQHGNPVAPAPAEQGLVRVYNETGQPLGLGEIKPDGLLHPKRLFIGL